MSVFRSYSRLLFYSGGILLLVALIAFGVQRVRRSPPPNIVLITIDTLRADHLSCYDYPELETPNIDAVAADGVLFENAVSPVPLTLPAHTSLLTGTYPPHHGIRHNRRFSLPDDRETLPEILSAAGYNTVAVVAAFILDSMFGLDQGFDQYDDAISARPSFLRMAEEIPERSAQSVTEATLNLLDDQSESPLFLWVHYFDPHFPYIPPSPYRERFPDTPYDGEIQYVDDQIGVLLEGLKQKNVLQPDTILIITSDHGESLGDHGEMTHGAFIYESTVHVPLIFKSSSRFAPQRISQEVSLVDLAPTLLDLLDLSQPAWMQGESMVPLLSNTGARNDPRERTLYLETLAPYYDFVWAQLSALRVGHWKFIEAPRQELYNLATDPRELTNLTDTEPARSSHLREQLYTLVQRLEPEEEMRSAEMKMTEETLAKLRALGYIGGDTSPSPSDEDTERKDPKEMVQKSDLWVKFFEGVNLLWQKRYREAIAIFEPLLDEGHPLGAQLRSRLATAYYAVGDYQRAIDLLKSFDDLQHNPDLITVLAVNYARVGKSQQALDLLEIGSQQYPWNKNILDILTSLYLEQNQRQKARESAEALLALDPTDFRPHSLLAHIDVLQGDPVSAAGRYRQVLQTHPRNPSALLGLAEIYADAGKFQPALMQYQQAYQAAPGNPEISYSFASFLFQIGRTDMAKQFFEIYLQTADFDDQDRRQRVYDLLQRLEGG